jgi:hypothetical protein
MLESDVACRIGFGRGSRMNTEATMTFRLPLDRCNDGKRSRPWNRGSLVRQAKHQATFAYFIVIYQYIVKMAAASCS